MSSSPPSDFSFLNFHSTCADRSPFLIPKIQSAFHHAREFPEGSYAFDVALQTDGKIIAARTIFVALILASLPIPILRWRVTTRMEPRTPHLAVAARSQLILSGSKTMPFQF